MGADEDSRDGPFCVEHHRQKTSTFLGYGELISIRGGA
jgi:hypothetical protein